MQMQVLIGHDWGHGSLSRDRHQVQETLQAVHCMANEGTMQTTASMWMLSYAHTPPLNHMCSAGCHCTCLSQAAHGCSLAGAPTSMACTLSSIFLLP